MPKLGDIKLDIVYTEDREKRAKVSEHPIEGGLTITHHVEKEPITIDLSGVCIENNAGDRLIKLENYMNLGKRLTYVGRYYLKDVVIESIKATRDVDVAGNAYKFEITIRQIIVINPVKSTKPGGGTKQPVPKNPAKRYHVTVKGSTLPRIALHYYGHSTKSYWMKIYNANKAIIGPNPNVLKIGLKLLIP